MYLLATRKLYMGPFRSEFARNVKGGIVPGLSS